MKEKQKQVEAAGLSALLGQTCRAVRINETRTEIEFHTPSGTWVLYHEQDCCESVWIEEIHGDLDNLVGAPIVRAEELSSDGTAPLGNPESFTWTFYVIATVKGAVTLRWYGESSGYYREAVDFGRVVP